jgi:hypothetical protein
MKGCFSRIHSAGWAAMAQQLLATEKGILCQTLPLRPLRKKGALGYAG